MAGDLVSRHARGTPLRRGSAAILAERPVPVAERSSRPGAITTALRLTAPTPCHGSAICTIDTEWIKANFPERYNAGPDAILNPDHIAEAYWQLHRQPRSAWTFEMDLRPWKETW